MDKPADTKFPVHDLIRARWSPRAFDPDRAVSEDDLHSLFEAARWAASGRNEQPWRFVVATSDSPDEHAAMLSCLADANQRWAKNAPVLMILSASKRFAHNDKPNRHSFYDCGLAMGTLSVEATARGLVLHQMAGFDLAKAIEVLGIPGDDFEPVVAIALGYGAAPGTLPDDLAERESAPRTRKTESEFVFHGRWSS